MATHFLKKPLENEDTTLAFEKQDCLDGKKCKNFNSLLVIVIYLDVSSLENY